MALNLNCVGVRLLGLYGVRGFRGGGLVVADYFLVFLFDMPFLSLNMPGLMSSMLIFYLSALLPL